MTDLRETIARAIADSICGGHVQWTDLGGRVRESYMGSASAVLSAIEAAGWVVVPKQIPDTVAWALCPIVEDDAGFVCKQCPATVEYKGEPRVMGCRLDAADIYRAMIAAAPPLTPEAGKE